MLPIVLDRSVGQVGLAGAGDALERRREWLEAAGVVALPVSAVNELRGLKFLFVAGLGRPQAAGLAGAARAAGVLVNVEDEPALCDFHVPALVRRGDFVLSVSTGGRAPALAKLVREWLDARFGPEWASYLQNAGDARTAWRVDGVPAPELSRRTRVLAAAGKWLE